MFKFLLLSIFVALATARIGNHWFLPNHLGNGTNPASQLLEGFNDYFHIQNATDFEKCANVPFLKDLNKTLTDLNASRPNPIALVADVIALYGDYNKIKASCPQVAAIYQTFFSNFTEAAKEDPKTTVVKVISNVAGHQADFRTLIAQGSSQYQEGQYYQAGQTLGNVTSIVLDGYISQ